MDQYIDVHMLDNSLHTKRISDPKIPTNPHNYFNLNSVNILPEQLSFVTR